jgi:hypothetical protein
MLFTTIAPDAARDPVAVLAQAGTFGTWESMPSYRRGPSRADHRMFFCKRCKALVFLCRACDRRHVYCSTDCAEASRRDQRKRTARFRATFPDARHKNAERQRRWRERQRARRHQVGNPGPVTYHQAPSPPESPRRLMANAKWPRPTKAPPASSRFEPLDRRNACYPCTFCGEHRCHRASRREVWPGPSRWRP